MKRRGPEEDACGVWLDAAALKRQKVQKEQPEVILTACEKTPRECDGKRQTETEPTAPLYPVLQGGTEEDLPLPLTTLSLLPHNNRRGERSWPQLELGRKAWHRVPVAGMAPPRTLATGVLSHRQGQWTLLFSR
ncbi:aurora kinase A and ninein-interacting protein isoform X3 [Heterocephalus glaber]|uniref:Aurora kinase A and ninein-interacting protein isoform X3 n=1 Tax=Heterocephalus glaber TaxID=10181 RepID=A0AAX6T8T8_HETGA|nr:aurora kinase A and ninein-interacting protein isoform X3 [Heterocephalus glaber]